VTCVTTFQRRGVSQAVTLERQADTQPDREFESIVYSELVDIASSLGWKSKKTYGISALRCAFEFGYKDLRDKANETGVLGKDKDRPKTNGSRTVELCPRALAVLKRQSSRL